MLQHARQLYRLVKRELGVYRAVVADPACPRLARLFLALAVGYLALPFDLIPDFIPVLGQLDDALIVPLLIWLAFRRLPPELVAKHRAQLAAAAPDSEAEASAPTHPPR